MTDPIGGTSAHWRVSKTVCAAVSALVITVLAGNTAASERRTFLPDAGHGNLTLYLDNDLFASTDENYTNGVRLSWVSSARDPKQLGWIQRRLRSLNGDDESRALFRKLSGFDDAEELEYNYGFSITQLMFTPDDPADLSTPPGQRPYAGWLGVDFSLQTKDTSALNAVSLAIGTTGPHSLAEQAQDLVHGIRGIKKFQGWDSQIPNELTVNLFSIQRRRLVLVDPKKRFGVDGFGEWRLALGNQLTQASVGALFRFGWNLPLSFADARLAVTAYSHQPFKTERRERAAWSLYGITGVQLAAVAHNITLDGPVFRNFDTGTASKTMVGEVYAGFGARYGRLHFSYVHTFRSNEFKGQHDPQSFGSLTLGYRL